MSPFSYEQSSYPIRGDLRTAYRKYWEMLAQPGNWWSGAERVAIAQETRNAVHCEFCVQRKAALSPYNFPGEHGTGGKLEPRAVDAVHRIITDQGRITKAWIEDNSANGLSEEHYVELLGIAVTVFSIDEFNRALGLALEPLPTPQEGEPDHYRSALAEHGTGFVPMLPPRGAVDKEADLWQPGRTANVMRALTLVPDALRGWATVAGAQYLDADSILNMKPPTDRSIDRMQMEVIAGRVSSYNECFY